MNLFRNRVFAALLPLLAFLGLFACSPGIAPTQPEVENISVRRAEPKRTVVDAEDIPLPNCGGSGPLTQSLGSEASVRRGTTIRNAHSVAGGAAVNIPEIAQVYLEGEIEKTYQDEYESANKRLDNVEMVAAERTHSVYEIVWEQISYESIVAFTLDGEGVEADYAFVMNVPKVADSRSEICPTPAPGTDVAPTLATVPASIDSSEVATLNPVPEIRSSPAPTIVTPQTLGQCEFVRMSFPQTLEAVRDKFALPGGERNFRLIYEGCNAIATGFIFEGAIEFEVAVPESGCIDSYSGAFFSDPPVEESFGGLRAYTGVVRASGITYRAAGCELKP